MLRCHELTCADFGCVLVTDGEAHYSMDRSVLLLMLRDGRAITEIGWILIQLMVDEEVESLMGEKRLC